MTSAKSKAIVCALACVMFLGQVAIPDRWQSPSDATLIYLSETLRTNEPGITDLGVRLSCAGLPVELLLEEEIVRPILGGRLKYNARVSLSFYFPRECKYLSLTRRALHEKSPVSAAEASIDSVLATVVVSEFERIGENSLKITTTIVEAEFHDQSDTDGDKKWDRRTCWAELGRKTKVKIVSISAVEARPDQMNEIDHEAEPAGIP